VDEVATIRVIKSQYVPVLIASLFIAHVEKKLGRVLHDAEASARHCLISFDCFSKIVSAGGDGGRRSPEHLALICLIDVVANHHSHDGQGKDGHEPAILTCPFALHQYNNHQGNNR
jgi:hypothetical protein